MFNIKKSENIVLRKWIIENYGENWKLCNKGIKKSGEDLYSSSDLFEVPSCKMSLSNT